MRRITGLRALFASEVFAKVRSSLSVSNPPVSALVEAAFWGGLIALAVLARGAASSSAASLARASTHGGASVIQTVVPFLARLATPLRHWFEVTSGLERVSWGGLAACLVLGLITLLAKLRVTQRSWVVPRSFRSRILSRLHDTKFDWNQALDHCELNPSPAGRVFLAAIKRAGRPTVELECAVVLARQNEINLLLHHVGTFRRIAAMAPLIGLLGSLAEASRILNSIGPGDSLGPAVASALFPLTCSVALAILALLSYDTISGNVDTLSAELDRIGSTAVEAVSVFPVITGHYGTGTILRTEQAAATAAPAPHTFGSGAVQSDPRLSVVDAARY